MLQNELIPPLIFFVVFSILFSLIELIFALILNRIERKHWEFMIDVVIRTKVHHSLAVRVIIFLFLGVSIGALVLFTSLADIFVSFSKELKLFALLLPFLMLLIYRVNVRKSARLNIEKKIYGFLFFIISLIFYIAILITAQRSYGLYADYLNEKFIHPTVQKVESVMENREDSQLLKKFRLQYQEGGCNQVDYTKEEKEKLLKNLLLIASEPELAFGDKTINVDNPEESLRGMACSDGERTYLLVENGNWYWVSEEDVNFIETDY